MAASVEVAPTPAHVGAAPSLAPAPTSWAHRLTRRSAWPGWANLAVVAGVTLVALSQLHPSLLLANTTTAGGDTGAHVMLPAFLKSHLLTHGQVTGWDPDWYDGFPVYTFYFPLPGLFTVLLNAVVSYDVAFKLVTVLGTLTLPVCAWAFGRLAGLRDPGPGCLAAATLPFLFEPSFSIYGGNILSTLAGEYSFSLSLSFAMLFLGVWANGLRTGRHRALAAVLFAITLLCHVLPAMFAAVGAVVWLLLDADVVRGAHRGRRGRLARRRWSGRLSWSLVAGVVGVGLSAWWLLPFAAGQAYTTNMGYTKVLGFPHLLFPASARWVLAADLVGVVAMVLRRSRVALFIVIMGAASAAAVCLDPANKLYNARFLPFWFLCLYLLAGYALAEVVAAVARWRRRRRLDEWVTVVRGRLGAAHETAWQPGTRISRFRRPSPDAFPAGAVVGPLVALAAACLAVVPPLVLPASALSQVGVAVGANQPSAWAEWNYSGYERKPDYPEYRAVIQMMAKVGAATGVRAGHVGVRLLAQPLRHHHVADAAAVLDQRLRRLDGGPAVRIGLVDAVPLHQPERTVGQPVRRRRRPALPRPRRAARHRAPPTDGRAVLPGLVHHGGDRGRQRSEPDRGGVERAVEHQLQRGGPRHDVEGLQGVGLVPGASPGRPARGLERGVSHPEQLVGAGGRLVRRPGAVERGPHRRRTGIVERVPASRTEPTAVSEPSTTVSHVVQTDSSISFHVDRIGTPVEVKVSYFPNWTASRGRGPMAGGAQSDGGGPDQPRRDAPLRQLTG